MLARLACLLCCSGACLIPPGDDDLDRQACGDGVVQAPEECDDGNRVDGDGCSTSCGREAPVTVRWRFTDLAGNPAACPTAYDTAQVTGFEGASASWRQFSFPCEDGQVSLSVFRTRYRVGVTIKERATGAIWGSSLSVPVDLRLGESGVTAVLYTDAGYLDVKWTLVDPSGMGLPCSTDTATITLTPDGGGEPIVDTIGCYEGVMGPLPVGTYTGSISSRGYTMPLFSAVTIEPHGKVTSEGPIPIFMH
jgi:cysteine-rich repeat protein